VNAPDPRSKDPAAALGLPWLVADIGGTNARFGSVDGPDGRVTDIATFAVADHPGPAQAVHAYLARRGAARPRKAAFAVATATHADEIAFTNSHWRFSRRALEAELGLDALLVLNDFEALALSLPRLGAAQLRAHGALPSARGTLAVVGPGTGLGVSGVVQTAQGWVALAGEGGHATLAPADELESRLLDAVRAEHAHVSAERLLSGIGLPLLHAALARVQGRAPETLETSAIVERGLHGGDAGARATLELFCALLGGFAGNVALTLGARGGLYIGGGIVPRLGDFFFASRFRARFEAKGRLSTYLQAIPTAVITDTLAALAGAAHALEQHRAG